MKNIKEALDEMKKNDELEMLKHTVYMALKKVKEFNNLSMEQQGSVITKVARMLK